jgi:hypothetical protein
MNTNHRPCQRVHINKYPQPARATDFGEFSSKSGVIVRKEEKVVKLYDKSTGQYLGRIDDDQLQFLIDNLEEESFTDTDYYINRATLDLLKKKGLSEDLSKMIEGAMGESDEVEIRYERA